jgi:hypothetical protein
MAKSVNELEADEAQAEDRAAKAGFLDAVYAYGGTMGVKVCETGWSFSTRAL